MRRRRALTRGTLCRVTGAPPWTIDYLHRIGRLPVYRASEGTGHPVLYHPDAVRVVRDHLERNRVLVE